MQFRLNKRAGKLGQRLISKVHAPIAALERVFMPFTGNMSEDPSCPGHQPKPHQHQSFEASKLTHQPRDFDS